MYASVLCIDLLIVSQFLLQKQRIMPYCVAYDCDNDTHKSPSEVSFHRLLLKKPAL